MDGEHPFPWRTLFHPMPLSRATLSLLQSSIETIESYRGLDDDLPETEQRVLDALNDLLASGESDDASAPGDVSRVLDLVARTHESEVENQRSVTGALQALSDRLAMLPQRVEAAQIAQASPSVDDAPSAPTSESSEPSGPPEPSEPAEPLPAAVEPQDAQDDVPVSDATRRVNLLKALLARNPSRLEPELDAKAPLGHRYRFAEEVLRMDAGPAVKALEEMSDLGLFQRTLVNRVHVCSSCEECHINFREECPRCDAIDLKVERVLHHFRCGYTGIESEFGSGLELSCPKCRRELFQLGQDFDRPHETYVCKQCESLFEEPHVGAQCLSCATVSAGHEAPQRSIFTYSLTPLSNRAVELGRLTGLEVDSILYDAELKIATRDFLEFEIKRELVRLSRHATAFSTATISFELHGRTVPIFRDWTASTLRELCVMLAGSLRSLDLVTRLDAARLGILMPEADASGASIVRRRLFSQLNEMSFVDRSGNDLVPTWKVATWSERRQPIEEVKAFLFPDSSEPEDDV